LATPATLVFADRLERNLAGMAGFAARAGVALRPHAKTHKCLPIAGRQLALGARGLSVATVGEAEILAGRAGAGNGGPGLEDVFIAYPLWPAPDLVTQLGGGPGRPGFGYRWYRFGRGSPVPGAAGRPGAGHGGGRLRAGP